MNRRLQDPHQALALPEMLEDALEYGSATCIRFNRKGTLLAAGLEDGRVVLWDFETRGVARTSQPHRAAVSGLAWSRHGRLITSAASDGSVVMWNIEENTQIGELATGQPIVHISINRRNPRLCLVSFASTAPAQLDFGEERSQTLPYLQLESDKGARTSSGGSHEGVLAMYDKSGTLILMTLARGCIAVLLADTFRVVDLVKVPGNAKAVSLSASKNGKQLLVNYQDRVVRVFEVMNASLQGRKQYSVPELRQHIASIAMPSQGSVLEPNSPLLKLDSHTFQNAVDKNSWKVAAFSSDVEYVSAASAHKSSHHIYIWNRLGILERILEEPRTGVRDMMWHPEWPLLATVSSAGSIYLWARVYRENWSAFAPDFRELQENEEYIEPEDVFDVNPKAEPSSPENGKNLDVETDIDILTVDPEPEDSSDEEGMSFLHHLPVEIDPQEFDDQGQLVKREEGALDESLPATSAPDSDQDPDISDLNENSCKASDLAKGKHRLASSSKAEDDASARLRPAKQKKYAEQDDDDPFEDGGGTEGGI